MPTQQGLISYTGVLGPKGGVYTQTIGVFPDKVSLRCIPQLTAIPATGTVGFEYFGYSIALPNCFLDESRIVQDVDDGFLLSLVLLDRRWKWHVAPPISGYYNVRRAGTVVSAKQKTLRELATILFTQMGEASADVTALSNSVYPEVRWDCEAPALMLDQLLREYGCGVSLGFGSETVTVVQYGTGSIPGTSGAMMISGTIDPRVRPQYVRVCFGPSIAQARFKLEPIALETTNAWVAPGSVSYEPSAGWEKEDPNRLPTVETTASAADYSRAIKTVYRAYRIKKFADDTLNLPDGSGALSDIQQCLPLYNRLLDSESIRTDGSSIPFRIYGKRLVKANSNGQPAKDTTSTIDDEIIGERVHFDGENGIIIFENPQFYIESGEYKFADLYLECSFGIITATGNYPTHYEKDVLLDAGGFGYHSTKVSEREARSIVVYGASQSVSSVTTNGTELDTIANAIATAASAQYSTNGSYMIVYNQPVLGLRCNGLLHQIQHIISDGTKHAGSITVAAMNFEFDRAIPSLSVRSSVLSFKKLQQNKPGSVAVAKQKELADD